MILSEAMVYVPWVLGTVIFILYIIFIYIFIFIFYMTNKKYHVNIHSAIIKIFGVNFKFVPFLAN